MPTGERINVPLRPTRWRWRVIALSLPAFSALITSEQPARCDGTNLEQQIQWLQQQNATLQQQLEKQNQSIQVLERKVRDLEAAGEKDSGDSAPAGTGYNLGNVHLSAEGGIAFFNTGSDGFAPQSDFRVDEARLFLEAPVWKEVYFFGETDLATRENKDLTLALGELYLDFQDLSQVWGQDGELNFRIGRMNIPFGEEYLNRYAIDNPLISHSVSDFWGFDPGAEIYGSLAKFQYVLAVQNGSGRNGVQDFDGDKSVAGRIGFDPLRWLHFSLSGMRTGDLDATGDRISALWFGDGFFQSLGGPGTTKFHADLVEGDVSLRWMRGFGGGHVSAFGGYARYGDNDPSANNGRDIYYYSVEAVQNLPQKFYAAARFSEVLCHDGIPILGLGSGDYFSGNWTTDLWRLSLGLGYRFGDQLVVKAEYSFEKGTELSGDSRDHEDFFGTEAAFKF